MQTYPLDGGVLPLFGWPTKGTRYLESDRCPDLPVSHHGMRVPEARSAIAEIDFLPGGSALTVVLLGSALQCGK